MALRLKARRIGLSAHQLDRTFKGYSYIYLRALLPTIVGTQVDYTKKPRFKLIGVDIKALGSQIKGFAQR